MGKIKEFCKNHTKEIIIGGASAVLIVGSVIGYKYAKYWYGRGFDLGQIFTIEYLQRVGELDIPENVLEQHAKLCNKWTDLSAFMELIERLKIEA